MFALGLASALLASVLFNVGAALQALEARDAPKSLALRAGLLLVLVRRWRWVLGLALGLIGVAPQALAFATAPFVVVQPALASGLLLLLFLGVWMLGEHVGAAAWIGVVAIIVVLALVSWGAPSHSETHRGGFAVVSVVAALTAGGLAPWAVRGTRLDTALLVTVASGVGFAATNAATKLASDDVSLRHWPNAGAWAIVALAMGVAATLTGMTAYQRWPASTVVPLSTAVQTFLPIMLEPLFLRERWGSATFDGVPIVAGLLVALVGTVLVSRTGAVSRLAAAGAAG